jgi:ERCC4-type nuclease
VKDMKKKVSKKNLQSETLEQLIKRLDGVSKFDLLDFIERVLTTEQKLDWGDIELNYIELEGKKIAISIHKDIEVNRVCTKKEIVDFLWNYYMENRKYE